jgi:hypothetical protein
VFGVKKLFAIDFCGCFSRAADRKKGSEILAGARKLADHSKPLRTIVARDSRRGFDLAATPDDSLERDLRR